MLENDSTPSAPGEWLTTRRFAWLLGALVVASWPQVFLGTQTFVFRDFGQFSYPVAHYLRESFWRGEIPLWNPQNYCGLPFLAQWNSQVFYPPALFYFLLPLSWSLGVFCLLHLYGAGLGMFLLARSWTGNAVAGAVAGVAFAFGGMMLNGLMWPQIGGLAWLPWLVWLAPQAWRGGGRAWGWAVVVGALQMLAGWVEPVLFTWVLLGGLWGLDFWSGKFPRGKMIGRAGALVGLVAGLCAVQLLPFLDLLGHCQRQENFDTAAWWPMPPWGWGSFFVPLLHAQRSLQGVFAQPGQFWTYSYYVGLVVVGWAGWAAWRVREGRVWWLWGATCFCLVLALGEATPVYGWCRAHLPVVGTMRFPVKFVIVPAFALPLLAAWGLAKMRGADWLKLGVALTLAVGAVLWWSWLAPLPKDDWGATWRNGLARVGFMAGIFFLLWLAERVRAAQGQRWLQVLAIVLVGLDGAWHTSSPPLAERAAYAGKFSLAVQPAAKGGWRAMQDRTARQQVDTAFLDDAAQDLLSRRYALAGDCNLLEGVPKVNGLFPLQLREMDLLLHTLMYDDTAPFPHPTPLLDFLGVAQLCTVTNGVFDWQSRVTAMPLLSAGQRVGFADGAAQTTLLTATNFNPRAEVYLLPTEKKLVGERAAARVELLAVSCAPEKISAHFNASAPSVAVVAQAFYHPWHAYVDGQRVAVVRANFAFQAVPIPAGAHELRLVYEDEKFRLGAVISLVSLALCVGLFVRARRIILPRIS